MPGELDPFIIAMSPSQSSLMVALSCRAMGEQKKVEPMTEEDELSEEYTEVDGIIFDGDFEDDSVKPSLTSLLEGTSIWTNEQCVWEGMERGRRARRRRRGEGRIVARRIVEECSCVGSRRLVDFGVDRLPFSN
jgi:hypothetical protein